MVSASSEAGDGGVEEESFFIPNSWLGLSDSFLHSTAKSHLVSGHRGPGIFHRALETRAALLSVCALALQGPGVSIIDRCMIHVQPRLSHNSRGSQWSDGDKQAGRPLEALRRESVGTASSSRD